MPLVALGVLGAVGSIGGAAIASSGAGNAANAQANASVQAAQIQAESQKQQLAFEQQQFSEQQREYNQNQTNITPWLTAGQGALGQLSALTGQPQQNFTAPTQEEAANDPGYQFSLQQGLKALQNSAAAKGGLLTTGTAKNLEQYGQGLASTAYNDVYNRNLTTYNTNQNTLNSSFNRLAAIAGVGQTAAGQIASLPSPYSGSQIPATLQAGGNAQANAVQNAGNATASGYASQGNIWGQTVGGLGQSPFNLYALQQMGKSGGSGPAAGSGVYNDAYLW